MRIHFVGETFKNEILIQYSQWKDKIAAKHTRSRRIRDTKDDKFWLSIPRCLGMINLGNTCFMNTII